MAGGIIETFGVLFESDADDVKKGADEAENATEKLGDAIEEVDDSTQGLGNSFLDLIGSAQGAIASIFSAGALVAGVVNAAQLTDEVGKFSETLGLNIEDVQAWSEAVVRSGGDVSSFRGSVDSLTEKLADFSLTGGGPAAEVLARLGINAVDAGGKIKSAFDVLPELAASFQTLGKSEATGLGRRLGLDQGTILLLQQGRVAVEQLVDRQRQLGVATQEDYEIAAKFNDQWADVKQVFQSLFVTAGSTILPLLTGVLQGVEKVVFFLADHQELVEGFFIGIAGVIATVYGPAIASAAAATLVAIAPFILIGAAITAAGVAFALIYEDIVNFIEGNDSLIGQIVEKYPLVGKIIEGLTAFIKLHLDIWKSIGGFLLDLFTQPQQAIDGLIESIKEMFAIIQDVLPSLDSLTSGAAAIFGFGDESGPAAGGIAFRNIGNNPLNGATSNSIVNSSRNVNRSTSVSVGEVNVNTQATDAQGIAAGASSALNDQMQAVVNDYDDGVEM